MNSQNTSSKPHPHRQLLETYFEIILGKKIFHKEVHLYHDLRPTYFIHISILPRKLLVIRLQQTRSCQHWSLSSVLRPLGLKLCNPLRPSGAYTCFSKLGLHWLRLWLAASLAQSQYLNQYWLVISWPLGNKFERHLNQNKSIFITKTNAFENVVCKMESLFSSVLSPNVFLTHWGWVTHICVSKLTSIGSDNGLSPVRCRTIIWNNAVILLIGLLGANYIEILTKIHTFSVKKMHLKILSAKCLQFCLSLT